jgi:hypothetical protein
MSIFTDTIWFKAYGAVTGEFVGLGVHCPVCGGNVRYGIFAGMTFQHCGKREPAPLIWIGLPSRSLGDRGNSGITYLGGPDDGEPNTNAQHFENEKHGQWV